MSADKKINEEKNGTYTCGCGETHGTTELARILAEMPPEEEIYDLADFFKIFADSTRIRILCTLLYGEMCVSEIGDALDMTQSAISHQLRVLKQAKLVKNRREGKTIYYSLSDGHIMSILSQGLEHIEE
ncbi:MAG TPA: transcriptional regulator [Lachnospiraceae bacterium]|nr:transcriptional regulator [Lachnospiraceae bacterium]